MAFDVNGARAAGYSDAEIAAHLSTTSKFNYQGARSAGYSDEEIVSHLSNVQVPKTSSGLNMDALSATGSDLSAGVMGGLGAAADIAAMVPAGAAGLVSGIAKSPSEGAGAITREVGKAMETLRPSNLLGGAGEEMRGDSAYKAVMAPVEKVGEWIGQGGVALRSDVANRARALGIETSVAGGLGRTAEDVFLGGMAAAPLKGAIKGKPAPGTVEARAGSMPVYGEGVPTKFADLREKMPEYRDLTDSQIVDALTKEDMVRTTEITPEQGALALDDRFGESLMEDWRSEAQGELATLREQDALARESQSQTKDMFQETGFPDRTPTEPLMRNEPGMPAEPIAAEQPSKLTLEAKDSNGINWDGGWRGHFQRIVAEDLPRVLENVSNSPVLQRTMTEVSGLMDTLVNLRNGAMEMYTRAATLKGPDGPGFLSKGDYEAMHPVFMEKFRETQEALDLQAFQLKSLAQETRDPMTARWAAEMAQYIGETVPQALRDQMHGTLEMIRKGDESFLGLDIEKVKSMESLYGTPRWPDPILSSVEKAKTLADFNKASRSVDGNFSRGSASESASNPKADAAVRDAINKGETSMERLLQVVAKEGSSVQQWIAQKLMSRMYRDTLVTRGSAPKLTPEGMTPEQSARAATVDTAAGRYFTKTNEALLRQDENITNILLHEATHAVVSGYLKNFTDALATVGGDFTRLPAALRERLAPANALYHLWNAVIDHRLKQADGNPYGLYGLKDIHEFWGEVSGSKSFRDALRDIKASDLNLPKDVRGYLGKVTDALQAIWEAVKGIFRAEDPRFEDTALDSAIKITSAAFDKIAERDQFVFSWEKGASLASDVKALRDALPEGMKHLAERLAAKQAAREQTATPNEAGKAVESARTALDGVLRDHRPYSEAKASWAGIKDIGNNALERLLVPGGKALSWVKEHGPLKWAVDTVYTAKENIRVRAQNALYDPKSGAKTAWTQLTGKEQAALWTVIKDNVGKKWLDREALVGEGFNEKQVNAYLTSRRVLQDLLTEVNAERASMGMEPIKGRDGYWPHRWKGNYELIVRGKSADGTPGSIVHVERGNNLHALKELEAKFKRDGQFATDGAKPSPRGDVLKDSFGLFNHLIDSFERNSPEQAILKEAMKRYAQELANQRKFFPKHFEPVSGVGGYLGDRYGNVSPERHARDAVSAFEGYVKDSIDWVHTNRANRELSGFLREAEQLGLKNTGRYVEQYWRQANGHESKLRFMANRAFEVLPELMGLDRDALKNTTHWMRHQLTTLMLGYFKPAFLAAQVTQAAQFIGPAISHLENKLDRKSSGNWVTSQYHGHMDATAAMRPNAKLNAWQQAGVDYLHNSGLVSKSFMETANDVMDVTRGKTIRLLRGEAAMIFVERYARTNAFFQFARVLKDLAPELEKSKVFEAAADLAEMAMVNYNRTERANLWYQLGPVGDVASALTSFKFNLATQLYKYGKEAIINGSPKPMLQLLAMQAALSGVMGMPFRDELDALFGLIRRHVKGAESLVTPSEGALRLAQSLDNAKQPKQAGDTIRYGALSGMTGVDISPTFSAGAFLPEPTLRSILPIVDKGSSIAGAALNVAGGEIGRAMGGQGSTSMDRMRLAKEVTPAIGQGAVEKTFQRPNGVIPNPNRDMAGTVRRPTGSGTESLTQKPWVARHAGARTTEESTDLRSSAVQRDKNSDLSGVRDGVVSKARALALDGKDWSSLTKRYMDAGGDPTKFMQEVTRGLFDAQTTQRERDAIGATNLMKLQQQMQLQKMRGQ